MIGATSVVIDQIASAMPRRDAGKIDISSVCEPGIIGPDTAPCITRKAISDSKLHAMPHRNDDSCSRKLIDCTFGSFDR